MDTRIALIGIILESRESVDALNHLLTEFGDYIIGRMGIPYREKGIHIISVALDAPNNVISSLSGKLGMPVDFIQGMIYIFVRACVHYALFEDEDYLKLQLGAIRTSLRAFMGAQQREPTGNPNGKAGGNEDDDN